MTQLCPAGKSHSHTLPTGNSTRSSVTGPPANSTPALTPSCSPPITCTRTGRAPPATASTETVLGAAAAGAVKAAAAVVTSARGGLKS
eukprot:CAMPEP_0179841462 /NCGR_PEP_ID=MMETSP0982-20121206/2551_1 /TAXON_ID=483367 /ORGANISM="non described non described, Strain CCMP 2436" /LENGTH=87 /DNA_ID=CAMNT_0021725559 /DNA_START=531 /DNA_END=794 /DNA_ORIENTATION=-